MWLWSISMTTHSKTDFRANLIFFFHLPIMISHSSDSKILFFQLLCAIKISLCLDFEIFVKIILSTHGPMRGKMFVMATKDNFKCSLQWDEGKYQRINLRVIFPLPDYCFFIFLSPHIIHPVAKTIVHVQFYIIFFPFMCSLSSSFFWWIENAYF